MAEHAAERIVEIGPSDTLGGMARRTLASKYEAYDAAQSLQRQILCYNKDAKEIYYDVEPVEEETKPAEASSSSATGPFVLRPLLHDVPLSGDGVSDDIKINCVDYLGRNPSAPVAPCS